MHCNKPLVFIVASRNSQTQVHVHQRHPAVCLGLQQIIQSFKVSVRNPNLSSSPPNWIYEILVPVGEAQKGTNGRKELFLVCF